MTAPAAAESSEVRQFREQRAEAEKIMAAAKSIMAAGSFRARAEAYCRFTADETTALMSPGVDGEFRRLLGAEPATREGELERQYRLSALRDVILAREQNGRECIGLAIAGAQPIPSDEELRERAERAREAIAEVDRRIAAVK